MPPLVCVERYSYGTAYTVFEEDALRKGGECLLSVREESEPLVGGTWNDVIRAVGKEPP